MKSIYQRVPVSFDYEVHFTTGLFDVENPLLADALAADGTTGPRKVMAVVDDGVHVHHPDVLDQLTVYAEAHAGVLTLAREPLVVSGGEQAKNDASLLDRLHRAMHEASLCRHSYVLAVGGGAVLDVVGYAAATAHRGVRLVRVPTTVLSQNDSGVGVKNGINAFGKKNFLGSFAPPYAVLNDFRFLTTLDDRDWRSGISEAVKVALLKDADFFGFLEARAKALRERDMPSMKRLIHRCAALHLEHIATSGDPFEQGSSRPLDFGHWAAHKLEQLTGYALRHGEAVAIGLALDCTYAHLTGRLDRSGWRRILDTLEAVGFALYVPELRARLDAPEHPGSLFHGLTEFREHLGGALTIMLLEGIGRGVEVHEVDLEAYRRAVSRLRARGLKERLPAAGSHRCDPVARG